MYWHSSSSSFKLILLTFYGYSFEISCCVVVVFCLYLCLMFLCLVLPCWLFPCSETQNRPLNDLSRCDLKETVAAVLLKYVILCVVSFCWRTELTEGGGITVVLPSNGHGCWCWWWWRKGFDNRESGILPSKCHRSNGRTRSSERFAWFCMIPEIQLKLYQQ